MKNKASKTGSFKTNSFKSSSFNSKPSKSRSFKSEGEGENPRKSFQDNQLQKKYNKKANNSKFASEELISNSKANFMIKNKRNHNAIIENSTRNHHFSIENLAKLLYQKVNYQNNKTNPYDKEDSKKSYTAELHSGGVARIARKIGEESTEVIIASFINQQRDNQKSKQDLVNEVCDLFYHTLVLLASSNITFDKILDELYKRNVQK